MRLPDYLGSYPFGDLRQPKAVITAGKAVGIEELGVTTGRSQRSHSMSRRELRASPITPFYLESSGALAVGQEQAYADDSTSFT